MFYRSNDPNVPYDKTIWHISIPLSLLIFFALDTCINNFLLMKILGMQDVNWSLGVIYVNKIFIVVLISFYLAWLLKIFEIGLVTCSVLTILLTPLTKALDYSDKGWSKQFKYMILSCIINIINTFWICRNDATFNEKIRSTRGVINIINAYVILLVIIQNILPPRISNYHIF